MVLKYEEIPTFYTKFLNLGLDALLARNKDFFLSHVLLKSLIFFLYGFCINAYVALVQTCFPLEILLNPFLHSQFVHNGDPVGCPTLP